MQYSLSYRLGGFSPGLDPDAAAYIAAVEADGATVSADQKGAINTFYKTGKSEGWYSSLKRMYLPIWAVEAANANCMVSNTSGTFPASNTIDHAAGYIQGGGVSPDYFSTDANCSTIGVENTGTVGALTLDNLNSINTALWGVSGAGNMVLGYYTSGTTAKAATWGGGIIASTNTANDAGILGMTRVSATDLSARRRNAAGVNQLGTTNTTSAASQTINYPMIWMARRYQTDPPDRYTTIRFGSFFMSTMTSTTDFDNFSFALKDLWETCTGLSLP